MRAGCRRSTSWSRSRWTSGRWSRDTSGSNRGWRGCNAVRAISGSLLNQGEESAEADAQRAAAGALKGPAEQQVITVGQVAEAEREKQVAIVAAQRGAEQERIRADVEAYKKKVDAEVTAGGEDPRAGGCGRRREAGPVDPRLAEANREAGLK